MQNKKETSGDGTKQDLQTQFVYNEVCESYRIQESSINLVNTKFNWLMGANIAIMGYILSKNFSLDPLITVCLVLLFLSLIISIVSLWSLDYSRGPRLTELINAKSWDYAMLVNKTAEKISKNIESNSYTILRLTIFLKLNIILFVSGLILIFIKII